MASHSVTRLSQVLAQVNNYPSSDSLFLPMDEVWIPETVAVIADLDEIDDPESESVEIDGHTFEYALGLDTLRDVVVNAVSQMPEATAEQLLEAFLYYYDHDAFIELTRTHATTLTE